MNLSLEKEQERLREFTELHEKCGDVGAVFSRLLEPQTKPVSALEQLEQAREALLRVHGSAHHDYETGQFIVDGCVIDCVEQALKQQEAGDAQAV